jgi:acyl-CoA thioester hydrolase
LAEVRSTWCCLDAVTRRPARLAREIAQRFLPQD